MMKRSMRCLVLFLAILFVMITAAPAFAEGTITIHYRKNGGDNEKFDFSEESITLSAYLIGTGHYGDWQIIDAYKDIEIFDKNGAFNGDCMTKIKEKIDDKKNGINAVSVATSTQTPDKEGIVTLQLTTEGMFFIRQTGSVTKVIKDKDGSVKKRARVYSNDRMLATEVINDVDAKWEYHPVSEDEEAEEPAEEDEKERTPHKLIIHYLYWDGRTAFEDYSDILWTGQKYEVPSPQLPGFYVSRELVAGIMPDKDQEFTVIYYPIVEGKRLITLEDYETALGLGNIQMHVGVCFE